MTRSHLDMVPLSSHATTVQPPVWPGLRWGPREPWLVSPVGRALTGPGQRWKTGARSGRASDAGGPCRRLSPRLTPSRETSESRVLPRCSLC